MTSKTNRSIDVREAQLYILGIMHFRKSFDFIEVLRGIFMQF